MNPYWNKACKSCGTYFRPTHDGQRVCITCRVKAERKLAQAQLTTCHRLEEDKT